MLTGAQVSAVMRCTSPFVLSVLELPASVLEEDATETKPLTNTL